MGTFHAHAENVQRKLNHLWQAVATSGESLDDAAPQQGFYRAKRRESVSLVEQIRTEVLHA